MLWTVQNLTIVFCCDTDIVRCRINLGLKYLTTHPYADYAVWRVHPVEDGLLFAHLCLFYLRYHLCCFTDLKL